MKNTFRNNFSDEDVTNLALGIINIANNTIDLEERKHTKVYFLCSNDLSISKNARKNVINLCIEAFKKKSEFVVQQENFGFISERDESRFIWSSLNFYLGNFGARKNTAGIVSLRDESLVIAHQIPRIIVNEDFGQIIENKKHYYLWSHYFSNYGTRDIMNNMSRAISKTRDGHIHDPCYPVGYSFLVDEQKHEGTGRFAECYKLINESIRWPDISADVHNFSDNRQYYINSKLVEIVANTSHDNSFSLQDIYKIGNNVCQSENTSNASPTSCIGLAYVYTLLVNLGFAKSFKFHGISRDFSWMRGAILSLLIHKKVEYGDNGIVSQNFVLYCILFSFGAILGIVISIFVFKKSKKNDKYCEAEMIPTINM